MDEDTVSDLKQFITTTVRQELSDIRYDFKKFSIRLGRVEKKIDDGFASIAETIDNMNDEYGHQFQNHEKRITKLEQKAA